jgi:hypothetical protein
MCPAAHPVTAPSSPLLTCTVRFGSDRELRNYAATRGRTADWARVRELLRTVGRGPPAPGERMGAEERPRRGLTDLAHDKTDPTAVLVCVCSRGPIPAEVPSVAATSVRVPKVSDTSPGQCGATNLLTGASIACDGRSIRWWVMLVTNAVVDHIGQRFGLTWPGGLEGALTLAGEPDRGETVPRREVPA